MYKMEFRTSLTDYYVEKSTLNDFEIEKLKLIHESNENKQRGTVSGTKLDLNDVRRSEITFLEEDIVRENDCLNICRKIFKQVERINDEVFAFDLMFIEPFQIARYGSEIQGFYRPHTDTDSFQDNITRKISFVIQLSDLNEFEGGDFIYMGGYGEPENVTQENPEKMQKGNIIVFPSFVPHAVMPVTKGIRYSLAGWCRGPRFR